MTIVVIKIDRDSSYDCFITTGSGREVHVQDEVLARWQKAIKEYEAVQREMKLAAGY